MGILESLIFASGFTFFRIILDKEYKRPKSNWLLVREILLFAVFAFVLINLIEFVFE